MTILYFFWNEFADKFLGIMDEFYNDLLAEDSYIDDGFQNDKWIADFCKDIQDKPLRDKVTYLVIQVYQEKWMEIPCEL